LLYSKIACSSEVVCICSALLHSTVNIENIEIKTDSLNNNQDFNRAGETLANAFNNAIQRRGLMINTKK
jgi:hypothetical protein